MTGRFLRNPGHHAPRDWPDLSRRSGLLRWDDAYFSTQYHKRPQAEVRAGACDDFIVTRAMGS